MRLRGAKHFLWVGANVYTRLLGKPFLAGIHHALVVFFLHALGYDNTWKSSYSGEAWFVKNVLKKEDPKVCLDIGAHVGRYSSMLLQELSCEIYAFEPSPASFAELQKIKSKRLNVINKAVSNFDGVASLFLEGPRSEKNSLDAGLLKNPIATETYVTTVDSFTASFTRIDFIKIDTEGFEREVFEGMQKTIQRLAPKIIQFEFNILHLQRGYTLLSLTQKLKGYDFYRLLPRGMLLIHPTHFVDNIFMFCNIVAIRKVT